jgi:hypothetical protein
LLSLLFVVGFLWVFQLFMESAEIDLDLDPVALPEVLFLLL